jgi:hypothetical protein
MCESLQDLPPDGVLLLFGFDWSSEVAYYAERRAITVPEWASRAQLDSLHTQPMLHSGGLPIVAVVDCPSALRANPALAPIIDAIVADQTHGLHSTQVGACTVWR